MAVLSRLKIEDFRNLKSVDLKPSETFNLIVGPNGSGKTSALEAIHVLSVGRSFRTHKLDPLVHSGSNQFLVFGELFNGARLGLQRGRTGSPALKLNGESQSNWADVAASLPLQVINTDSFTLLEGGGKNRRRFLDWAMFHVEHSYLSDWRGYRRIVSHRNALLKQKPRDLHKQLDAWDSELARLAENIHVRRRSLMQSFLPLFQATADKFLPVMALQLEYKPGWDTVKLLADALRENRERDVRYGMTLLGPHRADFDLKVNRHHATEVLSRGQIKMLVCALKLSMGLFIKAQYKSLGRDSYSAIYLIDDLAAELDIMNCSAVIEFLRDSGDQCFFTAITESALPQVADLVESSGKFHVEHGKIS